MKRAGILFAGTLVAALAVATSAGAAVAQQPATPPKSESTQPALITVKVFGDGSIFVDDVMIERAALAARFAAIAAMNPQPQVAIAPNRDAKYADIAFVMAAAQREGLAKLGVIGGT